ncbi:MAG: hypothetical protein ACKVQC_07595 [Elusimicrobiota bacterium]
MKRNKFYRLVRSPYWPALMSAVVFPGMGQVINKEFKKGIFLFIASFGSMAMFSRVVTDRLSFLLPGTPDQWTRNPDVFKRAMLEFVSSHKTLVFTFYALVFLIWVYAIYDAFVTAKQKKIQKPQDSQSQ